MNNLESLILNFKEQIEAGFKIPKINIGNKFSNIIISGMGGSNLVGDLLPIFSDIKIPIYTNRNRKLPYWTNKNSFVIANSYSGNTEETISVFKEALKKELNIIAISSNGKLQQLALKHKIPFIEIPFKNIQPRFSIWFQLSALIKICNDLKLIKFPDKEILINRSKNLKINKIKRLALKLAKKIQNKIILLYGSIENEAIMKIWKANFNENAKIPIFYNNFPELNHNEIAFLENKKINKNNFCALFLKLGNESPQIIKRIKLTKEIFKKTRIESVIIDINNKNIIESILSIIILGELSSIYLAQKYNINPLQIKIIEEFKKMMK